MSQIKAIHMGTSKRKSKKFKISRFFEIYDIFNPIEGRPRCNNFTKKTWTSVFSEKRFSSEIDSCYIEFDPMNLKIVEECANFNFSALPLRMKHINSFHLRQSRALNQVNW